MSTSRNQDGVVHLNPDFLEKEEKKKKRERMGVCLKCCCSLSLITSLLIGGTLLYLFLREHHLGCYSPHNGKVCYASLNETDKYRWFGTKTDYNLTVQLAKDEYDKPLVIEGCSPSLFYLFNRHTTRFPDREDISKSADALKRLSEDIVHSEKSRLCPDDLVALKNWVMPFVPDQDNMITSSGVKVTEVQVRRLMKRFPSIFNESRPYDPESIIVDFTSRIRSKDTAVAFMREWFTDDVYDNRIVPHMNLVNDRLLQFHKDCQATLKKKGKYVKTPKEVVQLEESTYYTSMFEALSSRLGRKVNKAEVKLMYTQCKFEVAIFGESAWCAVFTTEDLRLLEFREDLDDYMKDAFGNERNWQQACPVANDLLTYIDQVESPSYTSKYPKTVLHFSHAGAFKKVIAFFGVGHGPATIWDQVCSERGWHSSKLSPFNANILFVLYKCANEESKIVTLVNEKQVQLAGCSRQHCPLSEFHAAHSGFLLDCDIGRICS